MMTIDELASKMERINVLAELLLDLLIGNPQAQIITEVIIETSVLPEAESSGFLLLYIISLRAVLLMHYHGRATS